jgi:hypothetical protein
MAELMPVEIKIYRYPALYRVAAFFSTLLLGFITLGSVIVAGEAIKNDRADAALYFISFVIGSLLIGWGLDFATRSITTAPDGLQVRWLLRRSLIPWPDVLGWRYLPLSLIRIQFQCGPGLFVWPLLENYLDLLYEIDTRRSDSLAR